MKYRLTIDWRHWMIGFTLAPDSFTSLFSIGPINLWCYNEKKYLKVLKQLEEEVYNDSI